MKKTYFNHDSVARLDIRVIKLRSKLGYEGYGVFWAVLELLFTEENKLCIDDYDSLAFGLQCNSDVLKQVIEDFDLFVLEDGCFYSRRLNNHIEEINNKSNKAKENASKRWNNANAKQSHNERNASKVNKSIVNKSKSIENRIVDFKNQYQFEIFVEEKINVIEHSKKLAQGQIVDIDFYIKSREYKGKFYNSLMVKEIRIKEAQTIESITSENPPF